MGLKARLSSNCTKRANNGVDLVTSRKINTRLARPIALSPPEYLNRFRSCFTSIPMMWAVKNDFDANAFNLYQKAVRGEVSIRV